MMRRFCIPTTRFSLSPHSKQLGKFGLSCQHRQYDSTSSDRYGSDRYKNQFRPAKTSYDNSRDTRDYKYRTDGETRQRQYSPRLQSNRFEGSRTYGYSGNSQDSSFQRNSKPIGSSLKDVNWGGQKLVKFEKNFYKEQPEVAARTVEQIRLLLRENQISIDGKPPIPKPVMKFAEAGFPPYIEQHITKAQYKEPSAIQKIGFPVALSGRDFIGISRTGSGKTLAFLIPALVHIDAQPPLQVDQGPVALVLAPTRELACQIHKEAVNLGQARQIRCVAVYGGSPRGYQESQLRRGAEIVVACPGRLLDFLETGTTNLKRTTFLVLDEADRMLDMGFEPQIRKIVSQIRPDRQTLMYSATWPPSVNALGRDFCREDPVQVKIGSLELHANPDVEQQVMVVNEYEKDDRFMHWISNTVKATEGSKAKVLVFCSTRRLCENISTQLINAGKGAIAIHGQKSQRDRDRAIDEFRRGHRPILVATDVAARGLDITDITAVVNYDLPNTIEDYVHRIGRTARAGKKGVSLTFFSRDERSSESVRMAGDIARMMQGARQTPPPELLRIARM